MTNVLEFQDYKEYLLNVEAERATVQRGFRTRLAEVLACQNAYVSQVLKGKAHFSLEQGLKIATFLSLSDRQRRYFLLLIERARAGTAELANYFTHEIEAYRKKFLRPSIDLFEAQTIPEDVHPTYYSHWMYTAIDVLVTIPNRRTIPAIIEALNLPSVAVRSAITFMLAKGLLVERNGELHPARQIQLHLGKDSPHIRQQHLNCRLAAIDSLTQIEQDDIHYSTISSLSYADCEKIKARLVSEIQKYVTTVRDSKEETLFGFNLDFYSLIRK